MKYSIDQGDVLLIINSKIHFKSSDETVEYCASQCCPSYGFRCGYGACIDDDARCDGTIQCLDESDENPLLCGYADTPDRKHPVDLSNPFRYELTGTGMFLFTHK